MPVYCPSEFLESLLIHSEIPGTDTMFGQERDNRLNYIYLDIRRASSQVPQEVFIVVRYLTAEPVGSIRIVGCIRGHISVGLEPADR